MGTLHLGQRNASTEVNCGMFEALPENIAVRQAIFQLNTLRFWRCELCGRHRQANQFYWYDLNQSADDKDASTYGGPPPASLLAQRFEPSDTFHWPVVKDKGAELQVNCG